MTPLQVATSLQNNMQINVEPNFRPGASDGRLQHVPSLPAAIDRELTSLFKNTQPNKLKGEWQLMRSTFEKAIFQQRPKFDLLRIKGNQGMCDH